MEGSSSDLDQSEHTERGEPQRHHRAEQPPDQARPEALNDEQCREHGQRDRDDEPIQARRGDLEALDRRQHGDRRGDHAVAVEQRGPEHAQRDQCPLAPGGAHPRALDERDQRHDPAFAAIVGAHDEHHVLDAHDDRDRPEDQRQHAVDAARIGREAVLLAERLLHGVQRARADVAEDHAERAERQRCRAAAAPPGWGCGTSEGSPVGRAPCLGSSSSGWHLRRPGYWRA